MEGLESRFAALQEQLLSLIEKDSTDLADHLQYWKVLRQENILKHFARQKGLANLGHRRLPPQIQTETDAKNAIFMQMQVSSLLDSPYGSEPWTMQQISAELYRAPPSGTFKKSGSTLTLTFNDDPDDKMDYVIWGHVYYRVDNTWYKVASHWNETGIYYVDETGDKVYYVNFANEASRYNAYTWSVNGVHSSSSGDPPAGPSISPGGSTVGLARRVTERPDSPEPTARQRLETPIRGARPGEGPVSGRRRREGKEQRNPRRRRALGASLESEDETPPSPEEVGRRPETVGRVTGRGRLSRLIAEARDPPVLLCKGVPNTLKCWRHRLQERYGHTFSHVSTVWSWVESGKTKSRVGRQRMLIAFETVQQRTQFLAHVKVPSSVDVSLGNLDSL